MLALRPYQQEAVSAVYRHLREHDDNPVVVLPTGCHAAGHPILMFDGALKRVEEVAVGDQVMGPDSRPRNVVALCRGEDQLFRVRPNKGEPFIVNGDHVLSLVCTREGKCWPSACRGGEINNVTVRDYLARSRYWRHLRKLYRASVDFPHFPNLPIPPYILGLLIGDGCLRDCVELTTADDCIAGEWTDYVHSIGCTISVNDSDGRCPTYSAVNERGRNNILADALHSLGLADATSKYKFIPHVYLTATRQERLQLLAGLMDTDGSCRRSGFDYITASVELANDLVFLARSLGFASFIRRKYCYCQTGASDWYWRISVDGDAEKIPTRLRRKRPSRRRQIKSIERTGFSIEPLGSGPYFGFVLDGDHLYVDGHFFVHHNSGKTPVLATICRDAVQQWNGRVLVVSHVKELLEQAVDKLKAVCPELPVGVYSAGLNRRDTREKVIVAGIQSIYKRAIDFEAFDLAIIDESHLLAPDTDTMYGRFLTEAKNVSPHLRVIGLTATPFRLDSGPICGPDRFLNAICYEIGVKELIVGGYLSPLITKASMAKVDTANLHVRGGEFVADEVEELMDADKLVESACEEIIASTEKRNACLIFASGVKHGRHIARVLQEKHGIECGFVCGDTPSGERQELLARFRNQNENRLFDHPPLKYLCNVNVLTTGFDAPHIDTVVLLRPTMSAGLYYQMVGRGFRLFPGKKNCLVLDFGGNVLRHGPVDQISAKRRSHNGGDPPAKECPQCHTLVGIAYAVCPDCGFEFPPPERRNAHESRATSAGILSGQIVDTTFDVSDTIYSVHVKQDADDDAPRSMRVDYKIGWRYRKSEWICFEHSGYARRKAEEWWRRRSPDPIPVTAEEGVLMANSGSLAPTSKITVRAVAGEKFERIIDYELGPVPEPVASAPTSYVPEEIPF